MYVLGYRSTRVFGVSVLLAMGFLAGVSPLEAQPRIDHDEVRCVSRETFTALVASIQPPDSIRSAKLYFRSAFYPEFYFVEMSPSSTEPAFEAVIPLPTAETTRIVYYIEAVDVSFQTARSQDYEVSAEPNCQPGPGGLFFPGADPGIVVGATRAGMTALPAGFQATGVAGFIGATGASAGAGIGIGVAVGAAAGAAAGVGVIVATGGGEENGTGSNGPTGGSPSTVTTTISAASSSTTTSVGAGPGTSTTTIDGSSTTTTAPGPPPSSSTTTTAAAALEACFRAEAVGNCRVYFESCSAPESAIRRYEWRLLGPPVPAPPETKSFTFSFDQDPRCRDSMEFNRPVRLTVYDGDGRSANVQQDVTVLSASTLRAVQSQHRTVALVSSLRVEGAQERVRAQLSLNGLPLPPSVSGESAHVQVRVPAGSNYLEAWTITPVPQGSLWEIDFSASDAVVPGSLRPERGTIAGVSERGITFRLTGEAGEAIRFRLEIR